MTVTSMQLERVSASQYRLTGTSDQPGPYRLFVAGRQTAQEATFEFFLHIPAGASPHIAVLDTASAISPLAFPGRLTLHWWEAEHAAYYRVWERVGGAWVQRARVRQAAGQQYFRWLSRWLEDVTEHNFRVTCVGTDLSESLALSLVGLMVRHPDVPTWTWDYDTDTRTVTMHIE